VKYHVNPNLWEASVSLVLTALLLVIGYVVFDSYRGSPDDRCAEATRTVESAVLCASSGVCLLTASDIERTAVAVERLKECPR
jgi:hypothetical protein